MKVVRGEGGRSEPKVWEFGGLEWWCVRFRVVEVVQVVTAKILAGAFECEALFQSIRRTFLPSNFNERLCLRMDEVSRAC